MEFKEKIMALIKTYDNWKVFAVHSGRGCNGGNLSHPAFQELLEDINQRNINILLLCKTAFKLAQDN